MGLISKIEDKLSGNSSSSSNKLEKEQPYDSSSTGASHIQNPISSAENKGTYGTTGSSGATDVNRDGYGSSTGMPGSYDAYSSDRTQGNYVRSEDPRTTTNTTTKTTTNTYAQPQQPYDPYSSKGQRTAASATTGYPASNSTQDRRSYEDPSIARSNNGGVLNQTTPDQRYTSGTEHPNSAYSNQPTSSSQHHYGRDAAITGGAGAAGVGAYELGKDRNTDPRMQGGQTTSRNPQDISYMNRSSGGDPEVRNAANDPSMGGATGPITAGGMNSSTGSGGMSAGGEQSSGLHQAKKSAAAYEAGYRDAMEHMKAEMQQGQ